MLKSKPRLDRTNDVDFADRQWMRTRRSFFGTAARGFGAIALWHRLEPAGRVEAAANPLTPKPPHFKPRVKNIIVLFMDGGPSQIDLLDPKPAMKKWDGQSLSGSLTKDLKLAFIKPTAKVWPHHTSGGELVSGWEVPVFEFPRRWPNLCCSPPAWPEPAAAASCRTSLGGGMAALPGARVIHEPLAFTGANPSV